MGGRVVEKTAELLRCGDSFKLGRFFSTVRWDRHT
jgi:hypothetical protein